MESPILAISNKEAMIYFFDGHEHHFKKYDKLAATITIDAKKCEVLIAN